MHLTVRYQHCFLIVYEKNLLLEWPFSWQLEQVTRDQSFGSVHSLLI